MIVCISPAGSSYSSATGPTSELLVGTSAGAFALERSDSSQGWSVVRHGLATAHLSSLVYLADRATIFAGAYDGGVFATCDRGASWSRRLLDAPIGALTVQARAGGAILWAGSDAGTLYRSADFGATWSRLPRLPAPAGAVRHLAFDAAAPGAIFAIQSPGGLFRSDDEGATWRMLHPDGARRLAIGKNPSKLYLAGDAGLSTSVDAGATWRTVEPRDRTLREIDHLFVDPRDHRTLYVAHEENVLSSRDDGATWTALREGLPDAANGRIEGLTMHRWIRTAGLFAGTAGGDVYASEERGLEWELAATGLPPIRRRRLGPAPLRI